MDAKTLSTINFVSFVVRKKSFQKTAVLVFQCFLLLFHGLVMSLTGWQYIITDINNCY